MDGGDGGRSAPAGLVLSRSTSRRATARSCTAACGARPATSTTWAEGFISLSMALAFSHFDVVWAWLYFAFALTMFTTRQRDDDRHCAEKYGAEKWAEYKSRVKYRIFPASTRGRPAAFTLGGEDGLAEPERGCAEGLRISALRSSGTRGGASLSPAPFN